MSDMRDLYQEILLDHYKNPRNFRRLEGANHQCEGHNPLCGDRITVYALVKKDTIEDAAFEGSACAICTASASVMTEVLKGKTTAEAEKTSREFRDIVTGEQSEERGPTGPGDLTAFVGVREFPVRVKCAVLPWHTMLAALKNESESVTTE
jgi:nitrogen fixation NifU-like protein